MQDGEYEVESAIDFAEALSCDGYGERSASEFLDALVEHAGSTRSELASPALLFDAVARRDRGLPSPLDERFEIIAGPGDPMPAQVEAGDLWIRRALGEGGLANVSVVAAPQIHGLEEIEPRGLQAEGDADGLYLQVVEAGPFPHGRADGFARRISHDRAFVARDSLLLRLRSSAATTEATATARITTRATPGHFYQISRGDTLLGIAGRAYGVGPGATRLQMARLINEHPFNLRLRRPKPVNLFPQGILSFFPRFADPQAQLAARDTAPPRGSQFAVIFIPPAAAPSDVGLSITVEGSSTAHASEAAEDSTISFNLSVGDEKVVRVRVGTLPVRSFAWTSADPSVASVTPLATAQTHPNRARIRALRAGETTVRVHYVARSGSTFTGTISLVVAPIPIPTRCRTFVPTATDTLVVAQREFATPAGVTITNWADPTVAHKDREGTRTRPACRAPDTINEIIAHETVSRTTNRGNTGRPNVQLILHRDGTFTQHADLAHDLNHANHHNRVSFGFETVNPVLPRVAGAPNNGLPRNLVDFPVIQNTIWASQDRPQLEDESFGPPRNRSRHYVRPTNAQLESASRLIAWALDNTIGHGMNIPRAWPGRRGDFLVFGRDDPLFADLEPGIQAHGYFRHSDGYLLVLYAWLRLEQNFTEQNARDTALDIAANHIVRRREPGGRRTTHANLAHILRPPVP